jgi:hypothetical protein
LLAARFQFFRDTGGGDRPPDPGTDGKGGTGEGGDAAIYSRTRAVALLWQVYEDGNFIRWAIETLDRSEIESLLEETIRLRETPEQKKEREQKETQSKLQDWWEKNQEEAKSKWLTW